MIARFWRWLHPHPRYDPAADPVVIFLHAHRDAAKGETAKLRSGWEPTGHFWGDRLRGVDDEEERP